MPELCLRFLLLLLLSSNPCLLFLLFLQLPPLQVLLGFLLHLPHFLLPGDLLLISFHLDPVFFLLLQPIFFLLLLVFLSLDPLLYHFNRHALLLCLLPDVCLLLFLSLLPLLVFLLLLLFV
mmetsp:Transcript_19043/g.18171  ORF Transcript_19043/g.18171 Transcript_19043/m.18171 type:complete len:121 (-) Transcript_19043:355-717(-)